MSHQEQEPMQPFYGEGKGEGDVEGRKEARSLEVVPWIKDGRKCFI